MKKSGQLRTGALSLLAVCFAASAVLRAGDVLAERPELAEHLAAAATIYAERIDPEIREGSDMLDELQRERATLDERAATLDAREAELRELEARMTARFEEIKSARDALAAEVADARDAADRDVAHLAQMYESMKPKVAGQLFNQMEPTFAAGFLSRMTPEAAAEVLGSMTPEHAYAVSVLLAGRNLRASGRIAQTPAGR